MIQTVLIVVIGIVFAVAALLAIVRMIIGPSILDRAVASDVLLSEALCIMGAEAVINQHTYTLPIMLVIAATGVLGTIAVSRFVARRDRARERGER